jgi:hypothetical protein
MSWLGSHPVKSKAEAKQALPLGSCRICIYFFRCDFKKFTRPRCSRCMTYPKEPWQILQLRIQYANVANEANVKESTPVA